MQTTSNISRMRESSVRAASPRRQSDASAEERDSLVFVADHWGSHPSSAQHIARRLPRAEAEILWLETVGVTRPTLDADALRRGFGQVGRWLSPTAPSMPSGEPHVRVLSPLHWPSWRSGLARYWNGRLLGRAIDAGGEVRHGRRILVASLPLAATLLEPGRFDRVVYYCVDEFSLWPGAVQSVQSELEDRLLAGSDLIIAASRRLQERFRGRGYAAHFLPHGVDADHWRLPAETPDAVLRDLPRPLLTYWGLVDRRLDTDWIRACQRSTGGTVVLVGPQRSPDPDLLRLPGVVCTGPVPYDGLPGYARVSDALIMPYADLPVTRFMQPLKMLEYLCTDRPVVMRDLPACREWDDAADVVANADDFCAAVGQRTRLGVPKAQIEARQRARQQTWSSVAERFWHLVSGRARGAHQGALGSGPPTGWKTSG